MSRFSTTALYINQDHDRQSITAFDFDYEVVNSRIYKHAMADEGLRRASREAGRLVDASPWGYLTDTGALPAPFNGQYTSTPDLEVYTQVVHGIN
jgi:hypothetical protein